MKQEKSVDDDKTAGSSTGSTNKVKLIVDSTCELAYIYPTDLGLLNDAKENSETIIDNLYQHAPVDVKKPRTYRKKARIDFLRTQNYPTPAFP